MVCLPFCQLPEPPIPIALHPEVEDSISSPTPGDPAVAQLAVEQDTDSTALSRLQQSDDPERIHRGMHRHVENVQRAHDPPHGGYVFSPNREVFHVGISLCDRVGEGPFIRPRTGNKMIRGMHWNGGEGDEFLPAVV